MGTITLGQATEYPQEYAPDVLCPIPRAESRDILGIGDPLPFHGVDIWNAWELTWLDATGKPVTATASVEVPADSPNLVESKSLKLYLGSFAMTRMPSAGDVSERICTDLGDVVGAAVNVAVETGASPVPVEMLAGHCIDDLPMHDTASEVNAALLVASEDPVVEETLHTHLLRSLCPVTGQPDIGSVLVHYRGPQIDPSSLLAYVASFRMHQDFHEACVERMFCDIRRACRTDSLSVYARYTRRGGIDINPFRSDFESNPGNPRLWRQ